MNEPIAWMHTNSKQIFKTEKPNEFDLPLFTPLYAHPMRELTGKEIKKIAIECGAYENEDTGGLITDDICIGSFAEILLKASRGEK